MKILNFATFTILVFNLFSLIISTKFPHEALPTKSGYLTINSTSNSSIFYTFYEAQQPYTTVSNTPLLIWVQGGPGASSMAGNFFEIGPWLVNHDIELEPNPGAWNRIFGLLFLDSPIGTGFSIAASLQEIPKDQHGVAEHVYIAFKSFMHANGFGSRPVYIAGESYSGKYVPSIGYYIVKKNKEVSEGERINYGGIAISNGMTDPVTQVTTHGSHAYFSGLINQKQRKVLEREQKKVVNLVKEKKWSEANDVRNNMLDMLQNMTGVATLFNLRRNKQYEFERLAKLLNNVEVKKAIGANIDIEWQETKKVIKEIMKEDIMKSVKYKVEYLLKEGKVLLFQGQCDLVFTVVSVEAYMEKLKWEGIGKFLGAKRKVWKVKGQIAGYVQKWGNLSHGVVLDAGHLLPTDQPVNSQVLIEDWVLQRGIFANDELNSTTLSTTSRASF